MYLVVFFFFFQAEDGIRDLVRSRGLGDVYKRQLRFDPDTLLFGNVRPDGFARANDIWDWDDELPGGCLLYTSDAADERSSVDLGGRRIIKKKTKSKHASAADNINKYNVNRCRGSR